MIDDLCAMCAGQNFIMMSNLRVRVSFCNAKLRKGGKLVTNFNQIVTFPLNFKHCSVVEGWGEQTRSSFYPMLLSWLYLLDAIIMTLEETFQTANAIIKYSDSGAMLLPSPRYLKLSQHGSGASCYFIINRQLFEN